MAGTGKMGMSRKRLDKAKGVTKAVAKYGTVPGLTYTGAKKIKGMSKHEGPRGPRPLPKAVQEQLEKFNRERRISRGQATPSGQPNAPKLTREGMRRRSMQERETLRSLRRRQGM